MCGIVGILSCSPGRHVSPEDLKTMSAALAHRGPDGEGDWIRPHVALGHRRLAVIDPVGGRQPMSSTDGRFTIVFNGEIFNFGSLREELRREGAVFRTESDTEVVLQGWEKDGPSFLDRLDGMFAFLLFDSAEGTLCAARDPFGIKPLYRYGEGPYVFFASELKALRAVARRTWNFSPAALESYLRCGYGPGRGTIVQGVERVFPGTVVRFTDDGRETETSFARRVSPFFLGTRPCTERSVERDIISATERSLVSDVPVGLYLSGGIDSSLIASVVRRELGRRLLSFSVNFPGDPAFDEGNVAQRVADHLDLEHRTVSASPEDFLDLNAHIRVLEEPMADPSSVALGVLSGMAGSHLKVVLSGEGGDELFGGYHRYFWDRFSDRYARVPRWARSFAEGFLELFPNREWRRRVEKFGSTAQFPRPVRYLSWFGFFRPDELSSLLSGLPRSDGPTASDVLEEAFASASSFPRDLQSQWVDLVTFLRDGLLPKADKMSMAHGVEARVPLLQADVVRGAFSLPAESRTTMRTTKPFLRRMLGKYLPGEIVGRKKQGFEVPLGRWMRGPLRDVLNRYLSEKKIRERGLFPWAVVNSIRCEHETGAADRGRALYALCLLEAWFEEFLDR